MPLLDGKPVAPDAIDPAKHKFVGTFRPPQQPDTKYIDKNGAVQYAGVLLCPCGGHLWTVNACFDHWQQGHFDQPQYVTIKETT